MIGEKYRIPFDEKVKFTEKVKRLTQKALGEFVGMVQKMSAKAVKDISAKKLQIRVDDIDKATFEKLTEFLDAQKAAAIASEQIQEPPTKIAKLDP